MAAPAASNQTPPLTGQVAVITGGTSGIGAATVRRFVAAGAQVVFTGRSDERGAALVEEVGAAATFHRADVTREEDLRDAIGQATERFGRLDVLFNNAGAAVAGSVADVTRAQIGEAVDLLFSSVVLGIKHAVAPMREAGGGVIINNSSVAALRPVGGSSLYAALKAAVTHYTRVAAVELGALGIRVNSISPGAILTPIFWSGALDLGPLSDEQRQQVERAVERRCAEGNPLGRSGYPDDIAEAALYLSTNAFVTGHDLVVDGGLTQVGGLPGGPAPQGDARQR